MYLYRQPQTLHVHMPVYNSERYVSEAIDAVLADMEASGVDDFTLMLADDCSTDGTPDVLSGYEGHPNVDITRTTRNLGVGGNHKQMLQRTLSGDNPPYAISFRDNDDISIAGTTALLLDRLAQGDVGLVGGPMREFCGNIPSENIVKKREGDLEQIKRNLLRGHIPVWNPTSVFLRNVINPGDYPDVSYCDDLLFQAGLVQAGVGIANIDEAVVYYRKHESSVTTGRNPKNALPYVRAVRAIWDMSDIEPTMQDKAYVAARAAVYMTMSTQGKTYDKLRRAYRRTRRIREETATDLAS